MTAPRLPGLLISVTRPGGPSVKNAHRAGAPNHRIGIQEGLMMTDSNTSAGGDAGRHPATGTEQAVFLTVLADHLLKHPYLPPVNITIRSYELLPELHVLERDAPAVALAAWATSLGATEVFATALQEWHAVGFTARIGPGQYVEVWTSVDGLPGGSYTLTVAELADSTAGGAR